jgi:zinc protease
MIKYLLPVLLFVTSIFASTLSDSISNNTLKTKDNMDTLNAKVKVEQTKSDTGLTAKDVIDKYISAIGGAEKIYGITDRITIMKGTVQGVKITITSYQKAPNKLKQKIKAGSNEQVIIFNGEKGIMEMAGEKREITGSELEKLKYESTLTLLTDLEYYGIRLNLAGIEKVNDKNAYKVIMTLPSGIKWTQYYDVKSGLKLKEEKYINSPTGLLLQEITYSDYKETEGILFPYKITQSIGFQTMEFTVSSIKMNTGIADREFELE